VTELENRIPGIEATKVENESKIEELKKQINRVEIDAENVKKRIENDTARLNSSGTNAKQLPQIQHEIQTMTGKLSEIENIELELLSFLDELSITQKNFIKMVEEVSSELKIQKNNLDIEINKLIEEKSSVSKSRDQILLNFEQDLIKLYEKIRLDHGIGAAILEHNKCGACQITMSPAEFEQIKNTDPVEIVRCENCRCILVRS
jgi:predicted  nucleic acid-binding Zn-ribbon protein